MLATNLPGKYSLGLRQPFGVVAAISPWNAPFILGTRAIAIPLAVGNTVVLKPSEDAPLACGLFLADALLEAGIPDGVLNVVTNAREDAHDVVGTLIADERVRCVNFTGSTKVGRTIGTLAAQHLKPAVLELGGKNSLLVLKDADIDVRAEPRRERILRAIRITQAAGDRIDRKRVFVGPVIEARPSFDTHALDRRGDRLRENAGERLVTTRADRAQERTTIGSRAGRVEVGFIKRAVHMAEVTANTERLEAEQAGACPDKRSTPVMAGNANNDAAVLARTRCGAGRGAAGKVASHGSLALILFLTAVPAAQ